MKDEFKRAWYETMGWMAHKRCECCNWSLNGRSRKAVKQAKRITRKRARQKLKNVEDYK